MMGDSQHDQQPVQSPRPADATRRGALLGAAAGAMAIAGAGPGAPAAFGTPALTAAQRTIVLRVAKLGAVFPTRIPSYGETGSPSQRITQQRLARAYRQLTPANSSRARAGAQLFVRTRYDRKSQAAFLVAIGRIQHRGTARQRRDLAALCSLALGTVSTHFDPNDPRSVEVWLDGLARLHKAGHLARLAQKRLK